MNEYQDIHPGRLLPPLILQRTGLSQSALARHLGFNQPQPVNELINGKRGITPKMALLLEKLSGTDYPAEFWLLLQLRWDLAQAKRTLQPTREAMVQPADLAGEPDDYIAQTGQSELFKVSAALRELPAQH